MLLNLLLTEEEREKGGLVQMNSKLGFYSENGDRTQE